MAIKLSLQTQKTIFQVRYKAHLEFYNVLFSIAQRFDGYPHWTTNRLKVTLRNFEEKHNISISHDTTSYESDSPEAKMVAQQISDITRNLPDYVHDGEVLRIGLRHKYFVSLPMNQQELNAVLNGKLLNVDFLKALDDEPKDMTIVLIGSLLQNSYRITLGPMTRAELPRFLELNTEDNFDPNNREATLKSVYSNLPEISLYIDFDCFRVAENLTINDVADFAKNVPELSKKRVNNLVNYIFEVKL